MSSTLTVTRLLGIDLDDVQRGLAEATCGITFAGQRELPDDYPPSVAWDVEVLDAAAQEIREQVAQLLLEAVERRLPWTSPAELADQRGL